MNASSAVPRTCRYRRLHQREHRAPVRHAVDLRRAHHVEQDVGPFRVQPRVNPVDRRIERTFTGSSAPASTRPAICAPVNVATVVVASLSVMPVERPVSSSSSTFTFTMAALFAGTSFSIVTDAPASITTLSPVVPAWSKSVATNTEARLRAIVSASPPPVASGVWSIWSSSVKVNTSSAVPSTSSTPSSAPA